MNIGEFIKRRRKELEITQDGLAKSIGVSKSAISRYESNDISNMGINKAQAMAKALKIDPMVLLTGNPDYGKLKQSNLISLKKVNSIPLLGRIACGTPTLAEENIDGHLLVDFIKADFALRADGDSMTDAGIEDGDICFMRQQPTAENGEIVAVLIGEEATLKRLYKTENQIILQAENKKYQPLILTEDIKILGKMIGIYHKI